MRGLIKKRKRFNSLLIITYLGSHLIPNWVAGDNGEPNATAPIYLFRVIRLVSFSYLHDFQVQPKSPTTSYTTAFCLIDIYYNSFATYSLLVSK